MPIAGSRSGKRSSKKRRSNGPRKIVSTTKPCASIINLLEGDLDKFDGSWTFEERDGRTHVVLGVEYDFGVPTLAELIGPTLEKKVQENSDMMLAALEG